MAELLLAVLIVSFIAYVMTYITNKEKRKKFKVISKPKRKFNKPTKNYRTRPKKYSGYIESAWEEVEKRS